MASELTWLGHGGWSINTGKHNVLLDPFLDESPTAPAKSEDVEADSKIMIGVRSETSSCGRYWPK